MKKEKIICIIPARFDSERLPGKVLYPINGKSVLERVYNRAKAVKYFSGIYIATDSEKIYSEAQKLGAETIWTSKNCRSGSDRVAEAAEKLDASIIVNIQADEPFLPREAVDESLRILRENPKCGVTTSATRIRKTEELFDPNTVKIVLDSDNLTLYSSRSLIPYPTVYFAENEPAHLKRVIFYKHIGVYVFRKNFLRKFAQLPTGMLEKIEKLEHLRIIENGYKLRVAVIKKDSPCVDTFEDIKKLQAS
ncbi:MAG TPA: 3-deoxy-manno-octulosonate cytidylyltransferase [bacterium]|nr:3-deoxy-manno-octulosonate cytidylyltransferase [bacterium]